VESRPDVFNGGIMWSARWRLAFERHGDSLHVRSLFPGVGTTVPAGEPLEVPHAFFGLTSRSIADESGALHSFIINGRPFRPLITYTSWFPYGVRIDEGAIVREMDHAASLGVELFVLDAGWWIGAGENGDSDYDSGLGSWVEDADRFPATLAGLLRGELGMVTIY
jgi:alpha-galactosidase